MIEMITDRSSSDVELIKNLNTKGFDGWTTEEVAQYIAGLKGAYNASDLNRVESAVKFVWDRFITIGYGSLSLNIKTNWDDSDVLTARDAQRYLNNIKSLRNLIAVPVTTPDVPTDLDYLTYEEANDIEKLLLILDDYISKIISEYFYSGELYGGEI